MTDLLQLPAALARWGLNVVPVTGWQDRRRPGTFDPIGVLIHHTAAPGPKDNPSLQVCIDGRRDLPGPLCQLLVARSGKVYVIGIGRANHAGTGGPVGPVGVDQGNTLLLGIEAENDGVGEPWPAVQVGAMVRATAAVLDLLGQPRTNVWAHREYTPRKIDPAGITMAQFRADVAAARPPGATTVPTTDPVKASQQRLNDSGAKPPLVVDGVWGPACDAALDAVLKYQQGQMADLRKGLAISAESVRRLTAERDDARAVAKAEQAEADTAVANREAAEAEALQLRRQLQEGGRMPQLLADLDAAVELIDVAIGRARA